MGVIKKLDSIISNQIAAGEVIEKIGNVVKELVENSIDAGSTKIDIELVESGLRSITVTDNGSGMDETDALLAFERHATSKIIDINDLFRIQSLGFRGEALPSIAAVSRVELITHNGDLGCRVLYQDGVLVETGLVPANQGTKITVTRLFYATPARFKYLKSPQYELAVINQMINRFALAYPDISFRLSNDGKLMLATTGKGAIQDILANIYSPDIAREMLPFEAKSRDYLIRGLTSKPIINRSSKNYISLFVNRRSIIDGKILSAIKSAYEQLIPLQRYPITVLYIECDPALIDVNIHPRKQEIKFSEHKALIDLVYDTIAAVVQSKPIFQEAKSEDFRQETFLFSEPSHAGYQIEPADDLPQEKRHDEPPKTIEEPTHVIPEMAYIGQYSGTYLLYQNPEGLHLLDQHAAAERIRYERYLYHMAHREGRQGLLFPLRLSLSNDQIIELEPHLKALKRFGLEVSLERHTALIHAIPSWFVRNHEIEFAEEVLMTLLREETLTKESVIDELAKSLACKHSLKANHYISEREATALLEDLRQCEKPYTCPHGRPIIVKISIGQIERLFNRVI